MEHSTANISRRRGILAFLPDSVHHFVYNAGLVEEKNTSVLSVSHTTSRQRRRQRRNNVESASHCIENGSEISTSSSTDHVIHGSAAVVLLLVDPLQPSSIRSLALLVRRLSHPENNTENHRVHGIVVLATGATTNSQQMHDHLQHSGLSLVDSSGFSPAMQLALSWTVSPSLAVVETAKGQKISCNAELVALDWYSLPYHDSSESDPVLEAWQQGRSSLTSTQQALAAVIVPTAMPCSIF
jgi:hypothetical protein